MSGEKWCRHYTGVGNHKTCKVGIAYESVKDPTTNVFRYKCYDPDSAVDCASHELHTAEELKERDDWMDERLQHILAAMALIKPFRKRGQSTTGTIECPKCKGILDYGIAGYNGHTRGKCRTEQCLTWIQ